MLLYHELKLKKGQAEVLAAGNFLKEVKELTYRDKLYQLERLASVNERADKKVLQVFLSFGKGEHISNAQMEAVGRDYLQAIGFGGQPWLIYRHNDTLHPHAHLVSTTIGADGKSIQLRKADFYESRALTHALEKKYGLEEASWKEEYEQKSRQRLGRIKEGEDSIYPSMKLILDRVLPEYRYTSLDELNAVLGLYNVQACRGKEDPEGSHQRGLYYRVLGDDGRPTSHYFRAGAFGTHPGVGYLEGRFAVNRIEETEHRRRLTGIIDYSLVGEGISQAAFDRELASQQISVVRADREGGPGIWYVDHLAKEVYSGRRLGERYSAEAIGKRCLPEEIYQERQAQAQELRESRRQTHSLRL